MVTLIAEIDRSHTVGKNLHLNWECSSLRGLCGWWKTMYDGCPKIQVNTRVLHQFNLRKGFTPVSGDWIKGLVLNFCVNLWCKPNIKWPIVRHCPVLDGAPCKIVFSVSSQFQSQCIFISILLNFKGTLTDARLCFLAHRSPHNENTLST